MKLLLALLVAIYALVVLGAAVFQRRFTYFPDRRLIHPVDAGMSGVEELRLATDDGETIVAWHVPPREGRPLILYFHGNGGSLVDRVPRFRIFVASGYGLLAVSYRGYGGSSGSPTETGLVRDGEAAYREARTLGYESDRIVLMGESLGTAIATVLAGAHDSAALVLDSPFRRQSTSPLCITGCYPCAGCYATAIARISRFAMSMPQFSSLTETKTTSSP